MSKRKIVQQSPEPDSRPGSCSSSSPSSGGSTSSGPVPKRQLVACNDLMPMQRGDTDMDGDDDEDDTASNVESNGQEGNAEGEEQVDDLFSITEIEEALRMHAPGLFQIFLESLKMVDDRWSWTITNPGIARHSPAANAYVTQVFHQLLARQELTDGTGRPTIHLDQLQRCRAVMDSLTHDQECLQNFMGVWRNDKISWNNPELLNARLSAEKHAQRLFRILYYARLFQYSLLQVFDSLGCTRLQEPLEVHATVADDKGMFRQIFDYQPLNTADLKDERTVVVVALLREFEERGFRKRKDSDYIFEAETYTDPETGKKIHTFCYRPTLTISEMIYKLIRKEERGDLFKAIIKGSVFHDVVKFLIKGNFIEFPFLEVEPVMFSFIDGIWDAEEDCFLFYEELHTRSKDGSKFSKLQKDRVTYKFIAQHFAPVYYYRDDEIETRYPYEEVVDLCAEGDDMPNNQPPPNKEGQQPTTPYYRPARHQPASVMTHMTTTPYTGGTDTGSRYELSPAAPHRGPKRRKREWWDIQNERFERIFQDQEWNWKTIHLKYATMGRTLWPSGKRDNCQYIPVDIGESGTGKSTAQHVWQAVFQFPDVMIFGANQEKGFSRDKLPHSRIFLAPDMRGDSFGITPEFFLVIATNDPFVFPRKHQDPLYVDSIVTPGMLATNDLPPSWKNDIRGSIYRRLLPFGYTKEINVRCPTLKHDIIHYELAGILRKAVLAYGDDVVHPKDKDMMTDYVFQKEIQDERDKLQRTSNLLLDYLMSTDVRRGPDEKVETRVFIAGFKRFCKDVRQTTRMPAFVPEYYQRLFTRLNITEEMIDDKVFYRGVDILNTQDTETQS